MKNILVIIPLYNKSSYLEECLRSLLNQNSIVQWRCVVVNDGSIDDSTRIYKVVTKGDERFELYDQSNQGLSNARNRGLKFMRDDEYVLFLDADDYILPGFFNELHNKNFLNMGYDIILSDFMVQYNRDKKLFVPTNRMITQVTFKDIFTKWDLGYNNPIHTALFSKNIITNLNFDEGLSGKEDWDWWLAISLRLPKVVHSGFKSVVYRDVVTSMSKDYQKMNDNVAPIIRKYKQKNAIDLDVLIDRLVLSSHKITVQKNKINKLKVNKKSVFQRCLNLLKGFS